MRPLMNAFSKLDFDSESTFHPIGLEPERLDFEGCLSIQALPIFSSVEVLNGTTFTNESKYVIAYICSIPSTKGIISTEKLVLAGVPPGPLIRCLQNGSSVTLPDGTVVNPEDVSKNSYRGSTFIVVEIPDTSYLEFLQSCSYFSPHQSTSNCLEDDFPEIVVHFTPPEVLKDPRYRQWVNSFSPSVAHLIINEKNTCLGLKDSLIMQLKLNQVFPKIFPLFKNWGIPSSTCRSASRNEDDTLNLCTFESEYNFIGPTVQSNSLLQYRIRPRNQFDSSGCPVIYPRKVIESCLKDESVLSLYKAMNLKFQEIASKYQSTGNKFPNILFLGTGSAYPTSSRNVSSILLTVKDDSCLLMDCGEGTFNQLVRFLGEESTFATLRHLKCVYISHHHKDHHLGLLSILYQRQKAFKEIKQKIAPLYILATTRIIRYLRSIDFGGNPILENVILLNNTELISGEKLHTNKVYMKLCETLKFKEISMSFVQHVNNSFGIALTHEDGWKIAYSGDCMPSENFTKIGLNCDLLIHEATFEDGMEDDAEFKRHSTVSQAIRIGRQMKAKYTILTHFSQRYYKIPIIEENLDSNVGIAFDHMMITLDDLPCLPHIYPTLQELFYESLEKAKLRSYRKINLK